MQNLLNRYNDLVLEEYEIDLAELPDFVILLKERFKYGSRCLPITSDISKSGQCIFFEFSEKDLFRYSVQLTNSDNHTNFFNSLKEVENYINSEIVEIAIEVECGNMSEKYELDDFQIYDFLTSTYVKL